MNDSAGKSFPGSLAKPMKREAGTNNNGGGSSPIRYLQGKGTQTSANKAKDQPRTLRYLKG